MKKYFIPLWLVPYVLVLMLFVSTGFSQLIWQKNYGGPGSEEGRCVDQTSDGGYIVVGYTDSFGDSSQVYLVKTDSLGDTLWTKTYGGPGVELGYSVQQTADSGYIITGFTNSFGNDEQIYLIKTAFLGDTLWTKTYGGPNPERGYSVKQTIDGGYIIVGAWGTLSRQGDFHLIKTNSLGDTLWTKTYEGFGYSVQQTLDGGYIIAGRINNGVYLVKTDSLGDTLWTKEYYYAMADVEEGYSVQQTTDGGYIIAGYTWYVLGYNTNFYLIKTDSLGDTLWTREYGVVPGQGYEDAYSVRQTTDGGYIVAGFTDAVGLGKVYLVKTDFLGDTLWTKNYGGASGGYGYSVQQTADGGYIIAGFTESFGNFLQIFLIKTDEYGNGGVEENKYTRYLPYSLQLMVYPNPFKNIISIKFQLPNLSDQTNLKFRTIIKLYNSAGQLVRQFNYIAIQPFNQVQWNGTDEAGYILPSGVYFCRLEVNQTVITTKIVKLE